MLVSTQSLGDKTDNERKISSVLGLERKYQSCIVLGEIIEDHFVKDGNPDPDDNSHRSWSPKQAILDQCLRDMFIFESYRLVNWLCLCRKHGFLDKQSSLRLLCKRQNQIRELRDYLMHEEEYIVAGSGRKPKRYLSEKTWGVVCPSSTISFSNCNILGEEIKKEIHFGNKIEFFDLFELIKSTYNFGKDDGFFDLSKEFEIQEKLELEMHSDKKNTDR